MENEQLNKNFEEAVIIALKISQEFTRVSMPTNQVCMVIAILQKFGEEVDPLTMKAANMLADRNKIKSFIFEMKERGEVN